MAQQQFTPGPWLVDDGGCGAWGVFSDNDSDAICYMVDPSLSGYQPLRTNDEANAHLISAAPELYEALEEVSRRLAMIAPNRAGDAQSKEAGIKLAESVLAKARGEQVPA